jgi:hypothetical protein
VVGGGRRGRGVRGVGFLDRIACGARDGASAEHGSDERGAPEEGRAGHAFRGAEGHAGRPRLPVGGVAWRHDPATATHAFDVALLDSAADAPLRALCGRVTDRELLTRPLMPFCARCGEHIESAAPPPIAFAG